MSLNNAQVRKIIEIAGKKTIMINETKIKEVNMKKGLILLSIVLLAGLFSGCAVYANHQYGLSMYHDIEVRSGTAINDIFRRFGPPDQIHETQENIYYMFTGQSAMTILGISRMQSESMVVVTDKNGRVTQSYFVETGVGSTYFGSPDLFFTINP